MKYYKMALIYNENNCECNFKCIRGTGASRGEYSYQYGLLLELMNDSNGAIKQFERAYYLKPDY